MDNTTRTLEKTAKKASHEPELDEALAALKEASREYRPTKAAPASARVAATEKTILEKSGRALLMGDVLSLFLAFLTGGLGAWALNIYILNDKFQKLVGIETLQQLGIFMGLGLAALFWLDSKEHYRQRLPYWESVGHIIRVAVTGIVVGGFIQFAMKNINSRLWLGIGWTSFAMYLFVFRHFIRNWLDKRGLWKIPAILIGQGATAEAAKHAITKEKNLGYEIVAQIPAQAMDDLEHARGWLRLKLSTGAHHIFLALDGAELENHADAMRTMVRERLSYSIIPPWMGLPSSTMSQHHFLMQDVTLMHNTSRLSLPLPRLMKRSFDLVASSLGLLLLSPLMIAIALRVRADGGPALFTQERVGENGETFKCYKFRSMRVDAEAALQAYLDSDKDAADEWKAFQKLKKDPRITPFGEFIRRTSIDELPQLFNVMKGDMSLVGPRPIMRGQEEFYGDDFAYYDAVRPGITGPWQVSGRNKLTFMERVRLESWYVRNWTMWMDIVILLKTIPVLIKKDQAF